MYFLYLDDSGSPKNPAESHFVLGGVIIPEESLRWISNQIEEYAAIIDPTNPQAIEFHAAECFRAVEQPWKGMDKPQRITVIKEVLNKLKSAKPNVLVMACAIHKASFPGQDPVLIAYEDLSSRFDLFLENNPKSGVKQRGMIVIDKSSYELGLQTLAAQFRQNGNKWGSQLRNICEVPLFVDSKSSRLIQLADHIAYAIFRRYEQGDLNYFNCFEERFYKKDGIIHGLAHKQHIKESCLCPACISRK